MQKFSKRSKHQFFKSVSLLFFYKFLEDSPSFESFAIDTTMQSLDALFFFITNIFKIMNKYKASIKVVKISNVAVLMVIVSRTTEGPGIGLFKIRSWQ